MTDRDQVSPNLWVSTLGRLNSEAVGFNNHIANITGIVAHELETGRIAAIPNTISKLTDQFSALASNASSVLPRLGRFAEIVNTPSTLLLNNQKLSFLSSDPVVNSVGSILSSTASMASTVRNTNEHLCITYQGQIEGLRINSLLTSLTPEVSISVDSLSQDTVLMLGDRLKNNISTFNNLLARIFH